jgi:hypothetical protein
MMLRSYNVFFRLKPQKSNLSRFSIATPGDSLFVASPLSDTDGKDQLSVSLEGNELMTFVIVAVKRSLLG